MAPAAPRAARAGASQCVSAQQQMPAPRAGVTGNLVARHVAEGATLPVVHAPAHGARIITKNLRPVGVAVLQTRTWCSQRNRNTRCCVDAAVAVVWR